MLLQRYSKRFAARIASWSKRRQVLSRASGICEKGIRVKPAAQSGFNRSVGDALERLPPLDEELPPPRVEQLFENSTGANVAPDADLGSAAQMGVCGEGTLPLVMMVAGPLAGAAEGEYVAQIKLELASHETALHGRPLLRKAAKVVDVAVKGVRRVNLPVHGEVAAETSKYLAAIGYRSALEAAHDVGICHSTPHVHVVVPASTAVTAVREITRLARGKTTPGTAARHVLVHGVAVTALSWAGKLLVGFLVSLVAGPGAVVAAGPIGGFLGGVLGRIVSKVCDAAPFERAAEEFCHFAGQSAEWEPKALHEVELTFDAEKAKREMRYHADVNRLMRAALLSYRRISLQPVQRFLGSFQEIMINVRRRQRTNESHLLHFLERKTLEWWICTRRRLAAKAARENFHRAERQLADAIEQYASCCSLEEQLQFAFSWLRENDVCSGELAPAIAELGTKFRENRNNVTASLEKAIRSCAQRHRRRFNRGWTPVLAKWKDAVSERCRKLRELGEAMLQRGEEIGRTARPSRPRAA